MQGSLKLNCVAMYTSLCLNMSYIQQQREEAFPVANNRWEICLPKLEQNESHKLCGIHITHVYTRAQGNLKPEQYNQSS